MPLLLLATSSVINWVSLMVKLLVLSCINCAWWLVVWSWESWKQWYVLGFLVFLQQFTALGLISSLSFPAHISASSVASQVSFELQTVHITLDPSALGSGPHLHCIINRGSGGCLQWFLWTLSLASSLTAVTESTSNYDLKSSNNGSAAYGEMPLHWGGDDVTHSLKNTSQTSDSRRCCSSSLTSSQQATKWVSNSAWRDSVLDLLIADRSIVPILPTLWEIIGTGIIISYMQNFVADQARNGDDR
jgi:hypothetical protein